MKKRILSSLLAFVMLLSALPMGVYAAETRYSVAASPDQTTDVGKTVSMSVSVSGGKYNAYDLVLTYDAARLTYVSGQAADKGASVTEKSGSIRVIGYGADKSASTKVVTLTFKTKAAGTAEVRISSAKIDAGANAPTKDTPAAKINRSTTKFTIQPGYTVTLEDGLTSDSLSAAAGGDYTGRRIRFTMITSPRRRSAARASRSRITATAPIPSPAARSPETSRSRPTEPPRPIR